MKILVVGRQGQIAWELRRTLACLGEVIALDRSTSPLSVDLSNPDSICAATEAVRPNLIVNAAAYTAVDKAEQEEELAFRINAAAPGILAEQALKLGAGLIHYSTDYVFQGDGQAPYRETDATGPQGVYGRSKLAGEQAIAEVGAAHYILRTAWVYGVRGHNFLLTMLRLMRERELVRVVDDQFGAPTWSRLIAEATALMINCSTEGGLFQAKERSGIYHLTCAGRTSWYEFARAIRESAVAARLLTEDCARIEPIPTAGYPTPAKRPAYSVLSNQRLSDRFGLNMPDWTDALELCLADYAAASRGQNG
jgi:dTDP-4-dehydrorhamnose reductase